MVLLLMASVVAVVVAPPPHDELRDCAYLGITTQSIREKLSESPQVKLPTRAGLYITAVEPGGPAYDAGLVVGDIIVAINKKRLDAPQDLENLLFETTNTTGLKIVAFLQDQIGHSAGGPRGTLSQPKSTYRRGVVVIDQPARPEYETARIRASHDFPPAYLYLTHSITAYCRSFRHFEEMVAMHPSSDWATQFRDYRREGPQPVSFSGIYPIDTDRIGYVGGWKVFTVEDDGSIVIRLEHSSSEDTFAVVEGLATHDTVDDDRIGETPLLECVGTRKIGIRTMHRLRPLDLRKHRSLFPDSTLVPSDRSVK